MSIPREIVDEVRARTDIAEVIGRTVTLRRQGRSFVGLCPFHADKRPSFHVVPDKGIYNCFACGEGGDVFKFLMKTRGVNFGEAVRDLAGPAGVQIEELQISPEERRRLAAKADLFSVCEAAAKLFERTLLVAPEGAAGRAYLEKRGVTVETAQKYRLGFAPEGWNRLVTHFERERIPVGLGLQVGLFKRSDSGRTYDTFRNRLIFPILDDRGRVVAFGGRLLPGPDDGPKYLNSPESEIYEKSKTLYGLSWARTALQRNDRVLLVEGYFDAVSLWQAGVHEVVATCGTALTAHHLRTIKLLTRRVVSLFDSDEAGLRAATKSMVDLFLPAEVEAHRLELGDAKDPDEFVQKHGAEAFLHRLAHTEPLIELVVRRTIQKEGGSAEGRVRAVRAILPLLNRLSPLLRGQMITRAKGWLGYETEAQLIAALAEAENPDSVAPVTPAPNRWVPTKELSHLLWLVVTWPEKVAPVLATADPDMISDRREVLQAIARLCGGASLPEVVDACVDPEVARTLLAIAAKPTIYEEEQAQSASRAILARMELSRVEAQIALINARIAACETSGDKSSYGKLARDISLLYARRESLKTLIARRAARS